MSVSSSRQASYLRANMGCAGRTEVTSFELFASQHKFKVDEWISAVDDAGNFPKAALGVEPAGAGVSIERIEADGFRWPLPGMFEGFLEQLPPNLLPLHLGKHGHACQIKRLLYLREVGNIDGPRLFGLKAKSTDDRFSIARDQYTCMAHAREHSSFCARRRPKAVAVMVREIVSNHSVQRG